MSNRIMVVLDGRRYSLTAEEDEQYMYQVSDYVNREMETVRRGNVYRSGVDCATLTALNLADTLFKQRHNEEELRRQLKEALDDLRRTEQELKELQSRQTGSSRSRKGGR